jgi:3-hydroxyacyl-[acyl-carrier-protein] dehydratase
MESKNVIEKILQLVPHSHPFRFVDTISFLDANKIEGSFYLDANLEFFKGHLPNYPITPGVILAEIMGQIGMVAFGIYLMTLDGEKDFKNMYTLLTETNLKFKKAVFPNETVFVKSEKKIFRHGKLQCYVEMHNCSGTLVCFGTMSGMLFIKV